MKKFLTQNNLITFGRIFHPYAHVVTVCVIITLFFPANPAQTIISQQVSPYVAGVIEREFDISNPQKTVQASSILPKGELSEPVQVERVVDGDTITVEKYGTLRLIGIDTPETKDPRKPVQCYGPEASEYATSFLLNKKVQLEFDTTQDLRDKYDRFLVYVWNMQGEMYNQQVIANGFAREYTFNSAYAYQSEFIASEIEAQDANKGLWSPKTCNGIVETNSTHTYDHTADNYNCSDFKTQEKAQKVYTEGFKASGRDVHNLTKNGTRSSVVCTSQFS